MHYSLKFPFDWRSLDFFYYEEEYPTAVESRQRNKVDDSQVCGKQCGKLHKIDETHARCFSGHFGNTYRPSHIPSHVCSDEKTLDQIEECLDNEP